MDTRKMRILHALVTEYVSTAIPVGSKTLCERYELGCSPATVRAELSALEDAGYLVQPHTSAGRIPTDRGYRLIVDGLLAMRSLFSAGESTPFLDPALRSHDLDTALRVVSQALTRSTGYLTLTRGPSWENAKVRKLELLSLGERRILFVLVTDNGSVLNRVIDLEESATPEKLAEVQHALSVALTGKPAHDIIPVRDALITQRIQSASAHGVIPTEVLMSAVIDEIIDALGEADREQMRHGGVSALLEQPEFRDPELIAPLVSLLEEGLDVFELIEDSRPLSGGILPDEAPLSTLPVIVRIGAENHRSELDSASLILAPFDRESGRGFVGIVGPTRMNYLHSLQAVHRAARELSHLMLDDLA